MHVEKPIDKHSSSMVDVEKGEVNQTESSALLERLITHGVEVDPEPPSQSKPLIVSEKIVVTLLVVCFVVVEAYFVGVSLRDWLDQHTHGNSTTVMLVNHDVELVVPQFLRMLKGGADGGGQDEVTEEDWEPDEDFEGGLSFKATRVFFHDTRHQLRPRERDSSERTAP